MGYGPVGAGGPVAPLAPTASGTVPGAALNGVMMVPQTATPTAGVAPGAVPLTGVAGASGGGPGSSLIGGGSGDLASALTQVTAAIQQLVQVIGSGALGNVAGASGGGAPGKGPEQTPGQSPQQGGVDAAQGGSDCMAMCSGQAAAPGKGKGKGGKVDAEHGGKHANKHGKKDKGDKADKSDKGHKKHKKDKGDKPGGKDTPPPPGKPGDTPPPPGKPGDTPPPPGSDAPPPPGTDGGGPGGDTPPTPPAGSDGAPPVDAPPKVVLPSASDVQQHGHSEWDKAHKNVKVNLYGQDFWFDPTNLHSPQIADGRATWNYNQRTESFLVNGQTIKVTFKPSFSVGADEVTSDGYVKSGVNPRIGLDILSVEQG